MLFAAFAVAAHFSFQAVGHAKLARDWKARARVDRDALDPRDPMVIDAAIPGVRDDALDMLARVFDTEIIRTPATVDMTLGLAGLRGCDAEAVAFIQEGLFDGALAVARDCGSVQWQARALLLLGRFDEAAAIPGQDSRFGELLTATIGAGRWAAAAAAVDDQMAALYRRRWPTDDIGPNLDRLACIAELFRFHAGDPAAAERLRERARGPTSTCKVTAALLLPIDDQAAALAAVHNEIDDGVGSWLWQTVDLLLWTLRAESPEREPFTSSLLESPHRWDHDGWVDDRRAWLAPLAMATDAPRAHAWMAVRHAYAGDWKAAHAEARMLHDRLTGDDWRRFDPQELDLEIQLREAASPLELDPFDDHAGYHQTNASDYAALRRGVVSDHVVRELAQTADLESARAAVQAAVRGDGGPLAAIVERGHGYLRAAPGALIAMFPTVSHERERLAAAMRVQGAPSTSGVFDIMWSLAMRRDLARVSGDLAMASRCQTILDRYMKVVADRDKAIALLLLEL